MYFFYIIFGYLQRSFLLLSSLLYILSHCLRFSVVTAILRMYQNVQYSIRCILDHSRFSMHQYICVYTPHRRHIKTLEAFHIRCIKSILGIHWWHKVTHVEIRHRAFDIDSAEHLLLQKQLRWIGHVLRMPSNRLPRRILYGELVNG